MRWEGSDGPGCRGGDQLCTGHSDGEPRAWENRMWMEALSEELASDMCPIITDFYLLTPSGLKQIGLLAGPSWIKKQNILPGCNLIGSIYRSVSILMGVHLKPVGKKHLKTVEVNELGKPFISSPLKSICSLQGCGKDSMPRNCS